MNGPLRYRGVTVPEWLDAALVGRIIAALYSRGTIRRSYGVYLCITVEQLVGCEKRKEFRDFLEGLDILTGGNGFEPSVAPDWLNLIADNAGINRGLADVLDNARREVFLEDLLETIKHGVPNR